MNPLTDIIPASARRYVYGLYALVGLGLGGAQVGYVSAAAGQPTWLTVALAITAYAGIAVGATAASNTPRTGKHAA